MPTSPPPLSVPRGSPPLAAESSRPKPVAAIRAQYEAWPYPRVPRVGRVRTAHTWQLNADYLSDRCGVPSPGPSARIWIAGCGTLQGYVFALANPGASILATDLSRRSLDISRARCAWHGQRHVDHARVDLEDPSEWPDGPFDLIECYGVLMNLSDPGAVLAELGQRLAPGGVLRVMVYTHFGRRRIHQLQRLARLLGLDATRRCHPRRLRAVVAALPRDHPLRYTFATYADARTAEGIVDGFLHASDRGISGLRLGAMIAAAGLRPAFWFHRPWGQPETMASALGLDDWAQSRVLHYLDLWQELRTNFVVCLVRDDAPPAQATGPRRHPLFDSATPGLSWRHRLDLARARVRGARLPSRTEAGPVTLTRRATRCLGRLAGPDLDALARMGLVLGGPGHRVQRAAHDPALDPSVFELPDLDVVEVGGGDGGAANPLYASLFAAWTCHLRWPELAPGDLVDQVERWRGHADPLEDRSVSIGLTPLGTLDRRRAEIEAWVSRWRPASARGWAQVRLRHESAAFSAVGGFLRGLPFEPPRAAFDSTALRELWVLLFSHRTLFLDLA